jgi:hypothetical protein
MSTMKRSENPQQQVSERTPMWRDMQFVHKDGPAVRVRQYVIEDDRGVRYAAELTTQEAGLERAVIDAGSPEELGTLIEPAARAFSQAVRLRQKFARATQP